MMSEQGDFNVDCQVDKKFSTRNIHRACEPPLRIDVGGGRVGEEGPVSARTPGPWTFKEVDASGGLAMHRLNGSDGQGFAYTVGLTKAVDRANARLIAAAPDLLEAAQRLVKYAADLHGAYQVHEGEIQTLRAAIAKAEGSR